MDIIDKISSCHTRVGSIASLSNNPRHKARINAQSFFSSLYHFSEYGLRSISWVNEVLGWVCKKKYDSAIW